MVRPVDGGGTVNAIFRIGDAVAARFPRRPEQAAELSGRLAREAEAMAEFRLACPVLAPEPLFIGRPGHGYPLPWTLQTWLCGQVPSNTSHAASGAFAGDLAALIAALHSWDICGRTFGGTNRGGDLRDHDAWMRECITRSAGLLDTHALRALWSRFRELPREDSDVMSHTDLIPGNLLVSGERLVGVLDTADFRAADPALDLVASWHLLDAERRSLVRDALRCDDLHWERGKAWAFEQAAGLVWYYQASNPVMADLGRTTLARLFADAHLHG